MKELWRNFWTKQSFAVRGLRLFGVAVGQTFILVPVADEFWSPIIKAAGVVLTGGSALITGTNTTASGIPNGGGK